MALDLSINPYESYYSASFGTTLGSPMAFNRRADPGQRLFQDTMLRNNAIIRFTPGKYKFDQAKVEKANQFLDAHSKEEQAILAGGNSVEKERELKRLNEEVQSKMIDEGLDMRYLTFEADFASFLKSFQLLLNKVTTAIDSKEIANAEKDLKGFFASMADTSTSNQDMNQSILHRGFNLWVEKSTSISESVSNSFTSSVFEGLLGKVSRWSREIQALLGDNAGANVGGASSADLKVETANDMYKSQMSMLGNMFNKTQSTLSGSKVILPQIWDDSKFDRSYSIGFRFASPYGDDNSVLMNVIIPFLFILTLSLPRQDGPTGMFYPYLTQLDCPGYFNCQMGIVTSLSFTKGGDDSLFNHSGLPLVIQGTFQVADLYSSLSMPNTNAEFVTNTGTAAFIANLGGGGLYSAMNPKLRERLANFVKGSILAVTNPLNKIEHGIIELARFSGFAGSLTNNIDSKTTGSGVLNILDAIFK